MKNKFNNWLYKQNDTYLDLKDSWNAALKEVLKLAKSRNKEFKGNWQHEDIEFLILDIENLIEK